MHRYDDFLISENYAGELISIFALPSSIMVNGVCYSW
jgi:hypothetical protein